MRRFAAGTQQTFDHIERPLVDIKLGQAGAGLQLAEIGQQVTQAERGVDVFRVQRGQNDVGHKDGRFYHGLLLVGKGNRRLQSTVLEEDVDLPP